LHDVHVCTGAANIVRALRDNFMMYVLQSCNACTILGAACVHLATHARCGGTGTAVVRALQGDGRISRAYIGCLHRLSRLYPKAGEIMALIPPQRFRFALLQQHHRDVRRRQTSLQHGTMLNDRTTVARLNCNRTAITRRPCFHLTAALQTSCDNDFFKLKSCRTMSPVM
jgi:hypothetical protein